MLVTHWQFTNLDTRHGGAEKRNGKTHTLDRAGSQHRAGSRFLRVGRIRRVKRAYRQLALLTHPDKASGLFGPTLELF